MQPQKHPYIDALRGYAILSVIVVHTGGVTGFAPATAWGARGVQLFFVVSAFTLALSWTARAVEGVAAFYVRRIFRIAPMYWVAICFFLWTWQTDAPRCFGEPNVGLLQILTSATLTHGFRPDTILAIVPGGWSVADEAIFYWLFPVLAVLLTSVWRAVLFLVLAFMAASWWYYEVRGVLPVLFPSFPRDQMLLFGILAFPIQLAAFAAGFLAFNVSRTRWRPHAAVIELGLVAALCWLAWSLYSDVHNVPLISVAFGAVVSIMALGAGRYLVNPAICHVGKVSYSAYFIHFVFLYNKDCPLTDLYGVTSPAGFVVVLSLVTIVTVAIATITYRTIERPMIGLGERILRTRPARA